MSSTIPNLPLDDYKASQQIGATYLANAALYLNRARSAVGNQVATSSASRVEEASSFRFNVGTVFDVYAPAYSVNANQATIQAKNLTSQVFHNQLVCVNQHARVQNVAITQAHCAYNYGTKELFNAAPEVLTQASRNYNYGDHIKIQAGLLGKQPTSTVNVGTNYGVAELGAVKRVTVKAKEEDVLLDAGRDFGAFATRTARLRSQGDMVLASEKSAVVSSNQELALMSKGQLILSASGSLSISAGGGLSLDASMVTACMGGAFRPSVNLESLLLSAQAAQQVLLGNLNSSLSVPESLRENSAAALKGLPSEVFSSGVVQTATSTLLGAFTPANIVNFNQALNPEQQVGNIFSAIVGGQASKYGSYLSSVVPGLFPIGNVITDYAEASYQFDAYPVLEDQLEEHSTAAVSSDKPFVNAGGSLYADFNSYYVSQNNV